MSDTGPPLDQHLLEIARGKRLKYRTPAEIRAIPNEQWKVWLRDETLPFAAFAATPDCQRVLRTIIKATQRRMAAEVPR